MRTSNLFFPTIKESPNDAELISHQLMIRAGLIRKLASGLYTWLPLGFRVLKKVEQVIREEMNNIGAQEFLMTAVQPAELWQETGRWEAFGPQLLKMRDRHDREFCFGPTHEEVITDLIRRELKSYKQVPLTLYQIQTKFRDEIRPRFGVMRAREFLMKDAYSFHLDQASLEKTYQDMHQAYSQICTRLGLQFRCVLADSGNIGGNQSQEFHVLAESGEDTIAYCPESDYAANVEKATDKIELTDFKTGTQTLQITETPNIRSVQEQAKFMQLETCQILKTLLVKGAKSEHPTIALLLRGDDQLNPLKAEKCDLIATPLELISEDAVKAIAGCQPGFVGPIGLNIPLIADHRVISMQDFSCGANQDDKHYIGVNWERDIPKPQIIADLRQVKEGDLSPCGKGVLKMVRGIEVGHIFQLGNKYSKSMNASVLDETGKIQYLSMGCYGIGVSRIVAAAIEQSHDEHGIIWSSAMAPFQLAIVPIGFYRNEEVKQVALSLYKHFLSQGIAVLLEDRNERPGTLFKDLDLIGIPKRLVISEKTLANHQVEYKERTQSEVKLLTVNEAKSLAG